jgi:hypothetical protein
MMDLPDFEEAFTYENNFYLSCGISRLSKVLSQYELFKIAHGRPGEIIECGVFKGVSLARFAMMRNMLGSPFAKRVIGFDIFGDFPDMDRDDDVQFRDRFVEHTGTAESITPDQLMTALKHKNVHENVELIAGDITETIPSYIKDHLELKISLLNMDTGTYESTMTILENFYPRVVPGGVVILDNYGATGGETQAVDEYFSETPVNIQKHSYALTPCFIIKDD